MDYLFLLYLGEVFDAIKGMGLILVAFGVLANIVAIGMVSTKEIEAFPKSLMIALISASLVVVLIPSKQFMYTAVALKAGNEISQTPTVKKAIKLIDKYIDEKLDE